MIWTESLFTIDHLIEIVLTDLIIKTFVMTEIIDLSYKSVTH